MSRKAVLKKSNKENLPKFPVFKKLELSDLSNIEDYYYKMDPYSDFNSVSLWTYNLYNTCKISKLNSNIIILFRDYVTQEKFLTFLGVVKVNDTIEKLLNYSRSNLGSVKIELIPEQLLISSKISQRYTVLEDPANNDYILDIVRLKTFSGRKLRGKKNLLKRFLSQYPDVEVRIVDYYKNPYRRMILNLFKKWELQKNKKYNKNFNNRIELLAIKRLMRDIRNKNLICFGFFNSNQLIGFAIYELGNANYATLHFEKADTSYIGIYIYMKYYASEYLYARGLKYLNYEQDLGDAGLRKAKRSYQPIKMLRKYTITYS